MYTVTTIAIFGSYHVCGHTLMPGVTISVSSCDARKLTISNGELCEPCQSYIVLKVGQCFDLVV